MMVVGVRVVTVIVVAIGTVHVAVIMGGIMALVVPAAGTVDVRLGKFVRGGGRFVIGHGVSCSRRTATEVWSAAESSSSGCTVEGNSSTLHEAA